MVGNSSYFLHYTDAFGGTIIVDVGLLVRMSEGETRLTLLFGPLIIDKRDNDCYKKCILFYICSPQNQWSKVFSS
jgi:hypothetical protein